MFTRNFACLGILAVLLGLGGTTFVLSRQEPARDGDKKEPAKKPADRFPIPDFDKFFPDLDKLLPPGADPDQFKDLRKQMERMREEMRKAMADLNKQFPGRPFPGGVPDGFPRFGPGFPFQPENRLGAALQRPGDELVDQLGLPKNQGLVVKHVRPDSAAAKAGLQTNDILLELAGKAVPSQPQDFHKLLNEFKAGDTVEAVVLRKGKRETLKALTIPETSRPQPFGFPGVFPNFPKDFPNFPNFQIPGGVPGANSVHLSCVRDNDNFTTSFRDENRSIKITGAVTDGKAKVNAISIREGEETKNYPSVDQVPENLRDTVRGLIRYSESGKFSFSSEK